MSAKNRQIGTSVPCSRNGCTLLWESFMKVMHAGAAAVGCAVVMLSGTLAFGQTAPISIRNSILSQTPGDDVVGLRAGVEAGRWQAYRG